MLKTLFRLPGLPALAITGILVGTGLLGTPSLKAQDSFQGLGDLPGGLNFSRANAISADGTTITGYSNSANGDEAFRWNSSTGMTGLGDLPGGSFKSSGLGISWDGALIVGSGNITTEIEAFLWTENSGMIGIGFLPGGDFSTAHGVSSNGSVVVGESNSASGREAFRYTFLGGGMVGLGQLPGGSLSNAQAVSSDGSVITGVGLNSNVLLEAFRWTESTGMVGLGNLPGGSGVSFSTAVSDDGTAIVGASGSFSGDEAFRWTEETGMVGLGILPGGNASVASSVSGDGSIVVGSTTFSAGASAFIWDAQQGMRDLQSVLVSQFGLDLAGWTLEETTAISADGLTIAGNGFNPFGGREAWRASVDAKWIGGSSGSWNDRSNWALGINPNELHDLLITPDIGLTVTGPTVTTTLKSLTIDAGIGTTTLDVQEGTINVLGTTTIGPAGRLTGHGTIHSVNTITNQGIIDLGTNSLQITGSGLGILNTGLATGTGEIDALVANDVAGEIRVDPGDHFRITAVGNPLFNALTNRGHVNVIDGTFEVAGKTVNWRSLGLISGSDAVMRFSGGLENDGGVGFTTGSSHVFGDVENTTAGTINISSGHVTFYDDLQQDGTMIVANVGQTNSVAVLFGEFSGTGGFIGGGDVFAFGDLRPGASPASVLMDGSLFLGASTDTFIELAGEGIGLFDQMVVTGDLSLSGELFVDLIDGFRLRFNQGFLIADVGGLLSGQFRGLGEGDLVGNFGGKDLFISYAAGNGNDVALFTSVPEPGSMLFCLFALVLALVSGRWVRRHSN